MMSVNELHYWIAALGFGFSFASILCALFGHTGRFPYRIYALLLGYVALTFVVDAPYFDNICYGRPLFRMVRDLFNVGVVPMIMLFVGKLVLLTSRLTRIIHLAVWLCLGGLEMSLYGYLFRMVGVGLLLFFIVVLAVWMAMCAKRLLNENEVDDFRRSDRVSMVLFLIFLLISIVSYFAMRIVMPYTHIEEMVLIINAVLYLPMLLFFQLKYRHLIYGTDDDSKL